MLYYNISNGQALVIKNSKKVFVKKGDCINLSLKDVDMSRSKMINFSQIKPNFYVKKKEDVKVKQINIEKEPVNEQINETVEVKDEIIEEPGNSVTVEEKEDIVTNDTTTEEAVEVKEKAVTKKKRKKRTKKED